MTKYKLTPEHEKQLKPWADKWINYILEGDYCVTPQWEYDWFNDEIRAVAD